VADGDAGVVRSLGLGEQGATLVRAPAARKLAAALRAAPGLRRIADSELQTVDGTAVAWARRAERPIAVARTAPAAADLPDGIGASDAAAQAPDARARAQAGDGALRILPTLDTRDRSAPVVLAVEWRGATIDVARAALSPGDALVMVEPLGPAGPTAPARARVILLAPYAPDARAGRPAPEAGAGPRDAARTNGAARVTRATIRSRR